jgi:hypothetical protein
VSVSDAARAHHAAGFDDRALRESRDYCVRALRDDGRLSPIGYYETWIEILDHEIAFRAIKECFELPGLPMRPTK